jgi:hypothetical protein
MTSIATLVCEVCNYGDHESSLLLCDGCDLGYHIYCLSPKLKAPPAGDWHCPACIKRYTMGDDPSKKRKGQTIPNDSDQDGVAMVASILASQSMSELEWIEYLKQPQFNTAYLHNGLLYKHPPKSIVDSSKLVRKYLIHWKKRQCGVSYLHLSWMSEEELLIDYSSASVDTALDSYIEILNSFSFSTFSICSNLRLNEFYPIEHRAIEKITDFVVGDETIDHYRAIPIPDLHGTNAAVAVKWRGFPYSKWTYEEIRDLQNQNIEYETALKEYIVCEKRGEVYSNYLIHGNYLVDANQLIQNLEKLIQSRCTTVFPHRNCLLR